MQTPPDEDTERVRLAVLSSYAILDTPPEQGFDDLVHLAAQICQTPVSLVSLVASDRQWFKASVGFPSCETDLNSSVCAYVIAEPDLLVIPDLTLDPRTAANPLVTGHPHIRFYAGAPLRVSEGAVLGSLCVIDQKPRPAGLTADQADALRRLARQVVAQMEMRRAIEDQVTAERRLVASEAMLAFDRAHWRGLFERLSEGFLVGEVVRNDAGQVTDWRYLDVNNAWGELVGVDPRSVIGRTVRDVFPGLEDAWVMDFAQVADSRQSVTFTRQVASTDRWYEGRGFPLQGDQFGVIFLEVTDRVLADRRRDAMLEIGDRLREARSVAEMTQATSEIVGRAMSVSRAGFGRLDATGEHVEVEPDWTADGIPSIAGRHRFRDYGDFGHDWSGGQSLIVEDARTDPRTAADSSSLLRLQVAALVNVPIHEQGRIVAVFIVHDRHSRVWTRGELTFLRNVAERLETAVARLQGEAEQRVLNQELSHRVKNTLAMVQALAKQTLKEVTDQSAVKAFLARLQTLATAHDVLLRQAWSTAKIGSVVESVVGTIVPASRLDAVGPEVLLGPRATLSLSMLMHELATNAAKYGALSNETGRVRVEWSLVPTETVPDLVVRWQESGGPLVDAPASKGFGSRLIATGLVGTGAVELHYLRSGFEAVMKAPLDQVQQL